MPTPLVNVGGQAVIEGVMMRAPGSFAVAVRRASGEIVVRERPWRSLADRRPLFRLPLLRGVATLFDSVSAGFEALSFAADQAGLHGDLAPAVVDRIGATPTASKPGLLSHSASIALSLTLAIGLFVALPHGLAILLGRLWGGLALQSVAFQALAGVCKLGIFVAYLLVLGRLADVRRLFMYHGAEHKVIATFEAGEPLDVTHARRHTTFHARCGTSFLLVVVMLAIVIFSVVFPALPALGQGVRAHLLAIALKIPLMLPVAGLAYECNRWAAGHLDKPWVRFLVAPGFFLQRLTVREPTDDMLEVAIVSLKASLARGQPATVVNSISRTFVYQNLADVCARQV